MKTGKAILYTRVSTESQLNVIKQQEEQLKEYCHKNKFEAVKVYTEKTKI